MTFYICLSFWIWRKISESGTETLNYKLLFPSLALISASKVLAALKSCSSAGLLADDAADLSSEFTSLTNSGRTRRTILQKQDIIQ